MITRLGIPILLLGLALGSTASNSVMANDVFAAPFARTSQRATNYSMPRPILNQGFQTSCENCDECAAVGVCRCGPTCQCTAPYCNRGSMPSNETWGPGNETWGPGYGTRRNGNWGGWIGSGRGVSACCANGTCDRSRGFLTPRGLQSAPRMPSSWPSGVPGQQVPVYPASRSWENSPYFQ